MFTTILDNKHDIADHRGRHLGIMNTVKGATIPITDEITEFVKNWLAQHIKNTDFDYKGKMPEIYPIPEPYKWDRSFAVFYPDMDNEHKPLFTCVADLEKNPSDADLLASCLQSYIDHFVHEQKLFSASNTYSDADKYQHINKHNAFLATMRGLSAPVSTEWIAFIDVLVLVSIRVSVGCTEQFLFMNEMINVRLKARCEEISITGILLKISNTGEQRFVLIVHIRVKDSK